MKYFFCTLSLSVFVYSPIGNNVSSLRKLSSIKKNKVEEKINVLYLDIPSVMTQKNGVGDKEEVFILEKNHKNKSKLVKKRKIIMKNNIIRKSKNKRKKLVLKSPSKKIWVLPTVNENSVPEPAISESNKSSKNTFKYRNKRRKKESKYDLSLAFGRVQYSKELDFGVNSLEFGVQLDEFFLKYGLYGGYRKLMNDDFHDVNSVLGGAWFGKGFSKYFDAQLRLGGVMNQTQGDKELDFHYGFKAILNLDRVNLFASYENQGSFKNAVSAGMGVSLW